LLNCSPCFFSSHLTPRTSSPDGHSSARRYGCRPLDKQQHIYWKVEKNHQHNRITLPFLTAILLAYRRQHPYDVLRVLAEDLFKCAMEEFDDDEEEE
jgi:hypothetical protein